MIQAIISDFSYTLFFPKDTSITKLNSFHNENKGKPWYKVLDYFDVNFELLEIYKNFSWKKYIFTTAYIQEEPEIKEITSKVFEKTLLAKDLWVEKNSPETYMRLAKEVWISPKNILFVDDSQANILWAKEAWMQAFLYSKEKNEELRKILEA